MADYIPAGDADAIAEGRIRVEYAKDNFASLNVTLADITPIETALDLFETKYDDNLAKQAGAQSAREAKDNARDEWETLDRAFNGRMQADLAVSDEERAAMKLRVYDKTKTGSAGAIGTFPVAIVDTSQKLRHEISWRDSGTPDSRAKPPGVFACQIFYKIGGDAPVDVKECEEAAVDRNAPYLMQFDGADGGKTCWYLLRWILNSGEKGAISPLYSATITN